MSTEVEILQKGTTMKIVIINRTNGYLFNELYRKGRANNWCFEYINVPRYVDEVQDAGWITKRLKDANYCVFGYVGTVQLKVMAKIAIDYFNATNRARRVLFYDNEAGEAWTLTGTEAYTYTDRQGSEKNTFTLVKELRSEEYFTVSDQDIVKYTPYIRLYDMEYPTDRESWMRAVQQIRYYLENDLSFQLEKTETIKNVMEYYGISLHFNEDDTKRLIEDGLEELLTYDGTTRIYDWDLEVQQTARDRKKLKHYGLEYKIKRK